MFLPTRQLDSTLKGIWLFVLEVCVYAHALSLSMNTVRSFFLFTQTGLSHAKAGDPLAPDGCVGRTFLRVRDSYVEGCGPAKQTLCRVVLPFGEAVAWQQEQWCSPPTPTLYVWWPRPQGRMAAALKCCGCWLLCVFCLHPLFWFFCSFFSFVIVFGDVCSPLPGVIHCFYRFK